MPIAPSFFPNSQEYPSTSWGLLPEEMASVFLLLLSPWWGVYQAGQLLSPSSQKLDSAQSLPPSMGSPLRGVRKQAQQGQSAGCSGQDLFTSNHESMQLEWGIKGNTLAADNTVPAKGAFQGVGLSGRAF